jgi:FdhD protein
LSRKIYPNPSKSRHLRADAGGCVENFVQRNIVHWNFHSIETKTDLMIREEPLSIRIQGIPYAVVMRTPGEEKAHAAGFCLGEGIVDAVEDMVSLAVCDGSDTNVVTVTLTELRRKSIPDMLDRRQYVSQTSCGLCGKELVEELHQKIPPFSDNLVVDINSAISGINTLSTHQILRNKTRAAHAAALLTKNFELLSISEDVGRHNALDKAAGKLFLDRRLHEAHVLVLSSRISYELVQKSARAGVPIILAVSRPTSLAVELAAELNMTLASLARPSGLDVYCGEHRFSTASTI